MLSSEYPNKKKGCEIGGLIPELFLELNCANEHIHHNQGFVCELYLGRS